MDGGPRGVQILKWDGGSGVVVRIGAVVRGWSDRAAAVARLAIGAFASSVALGIFDKNAEWYRWPVVVCGQARFPGAPGRWASAGV